MPQGLKPDTRVRKEIPEEYHWNPNHIFPTWEKWESACAELDALIEKLASFKGTMNQGSQHLYTYLQLQDRAGELSHRVWYYPALQFDTDQRRNELDAKRQKVQAMFVRFATATSWYSPEVLGLGWGTVEKWLAEDRELALYRFTLSELFRLQEHVLDEKGERIMALSGRFASTPPSIYSMLTTADAKHPDVTLSTGETVKVSHAAYGSMLRTLRNQEDREKVFRAHYGTFEGLANTCAAIYNSVLQRGWFHAQARSYTSVLEARLEGNAIPASVVNTLVSTAKAGTGPLRRYHQLRKKFLRLEKYHLYDGFVGLFEEQKKYPFRDVQQIILESVQPLGDTYVRKMEAAFHERWIDVYENEGKRSGAYSAGVYGVHPYMLLNYQDTLDDVFTLAHELGHSMHTILADESQPYVYSDYTIFVAEVASTLNEALLLDTMLEKSESPRERAILLQHAIDSIAGTFFTQALFAAYELEAHRLAEAGEPITADVLNQLYYGLLQEFYGDSIDHDELYRVTWARIPHFFNSPYYVYQYATCYASSALLMRDIQSSDQAVRQAAVDRYLNLLRAGGSDHPTSLLKAAGVDLEQPETVLAVVDQLDTLVTQLEQEIDRLAH